MQKVVLLFCFLSSLFPQEMAFWKRKCDRQEKKAFKEEAQL